MKVGKTIDVWWGWGWEPRTVVKVGRDQLTVDLGDGLGEQELRRADVGKTWRPCRPLRGGRA